MFGKTAAQFYAKQSYKQLNKLYRPTWLPTEQVDIGDIGILKRGVFMRLAGFVDQVGGAPIGIRQDASAAPIDITYSKATKFVFKAAGETKADLPNIPQAKAGFGVEFSRTGAFTVRAEETYEPSVDNIIKLQERIIDLYAAGDWDKSWVVVVKRVYCTAATILISKSSTTKLEFSASGDVPAGAVPIGSANVSFQLEAATNQAFNFPNAREVTPFVQLVSLGQKWSSDGLFEAKVAARESGSFEMPDLSRVTPRRVREDNALRDSLSLVLASDPADDSDLDDE